ncbi:MAG: twin-arginine translocase subunit TatC [Planctomycetota bacterium]
MLKLDQNFDPDDFRMPVGEHLEELRSRLIKVLIGVVIATGVCLFFCRDYVLPAFCRPLILTQLEAGVSPQTYFNTLPGPFTIFLKVSIICGIVLASPWVIWHFWQFVAAGLYPNERRAVTKYIPLSIFLTFLGVALAYFFVLPITLQFFLSFGLSIPLPGYEASSTAPLAEGVVLPQVALVTADPVDPAAGSQWFNTTESRLKIFDGKTTHVQQFAPTSLASPLIELPAYINLAMVMIAVFGAAFQLPLVVLGVVAAGIVEPRDLRENRKYVIFGLAALAAIVTPADVLSMALLAAPLVLLYELGILLASRKTNPEP